MTRIRVRRFLLALALMLPFGPAAYARPPTDDGPTTQLPPPDPIAHQDPVVVVSHYGSPLWVFIIVAATAVAVTLCVQLGVQWMPALRQRLRHA
jgi:drug/metabolite transporter (DMT)-like permease